jgi:single-stranded DNA-binding protein
MALNKVSIMGRITGDLELKHVGANGDIPTVSFGIACPRDFKNKGTGK